MATDYPKLPATGRRTTAPEVLETIERTWYWAHTNACWANTPQLYALMTQLIEDLQAHADDVQALLDVPAQEPVTPEHALMRDIERSP